MDTSRSFKEQRLADAWTELQEQSQEGVSLEPNPFRLAFADPEFLLRRDTRGIRIQLELFKPDLAQMEKGIEHTIVVFGSARLREPAVAQQMLDEALKKGDTQAIKQAQTLVRNAHYYEDARMFGHLVAKHGKNCPTSTQLFICTGGGPGIMEAANRGAFEEGALSIGLNIGGLPHEQPGNPYISPELCFKFHYFALRKMHFMMRAKALVVFPGGFGTLDELFEVLTLVQCEKAKPVPIVLYGSSYWKRLIQFDVLLEEGLISENDLDLFKMIDSPEEAWAYIRDFYDLSETENGYCLIP